MPTLVKEIKYGEDLPIEEAPQLTEEDKFEIQRRIQVLEKELSAQGKAKYKIELFFPRSRSMRKPTLGMMSFWLSGSKLHGGGDEKLYICPAKTLGKADCDEFIPPDGQGYGHLVCKKCGNVWLGTQVHGEHIANNTMRNWAELILRFYVKLQHNADIILKHSPDDIRSVAMIEQQKQLMGEKLTAIRNKRAIHIYPLKNIIADASSGADLLGRFYSFLVA